VPIPKRPLAVKTDSTPPFVFQISIILAT
jgi:hypothetical protein